MVIAIVGPTASGKTELALKLAREQNGEIISVDSRQVYRHLHIGTAKPEGVWVAGLYLVAGIPYHLVDIWEPDQIFTAADFVQLASEKIAEITRRGKTPILAGGTGLYFKALFEGLAPLPPRDETLRQKLHALAEEKGRPFLHRQLAHVDPAAAAKIPINNIARVTRALEVYELTGKPISEWHKEHQNNQRIASFKQLERSNVEEISSCLKDVTYRGIWSEKAELHARIAGRCAAMLKDGMIEETEQLLKKGYARDCPALSGLGYPRVLDHLDGRLTREALLMFLIQDTRQYAKRQLTWFRHQMGVTWKK